MSLLELEDFLPYRLSVVANQISGSLEKIYSDPYDLKPIEWKIMAVLSNYDSMTATELCSKTRLHKVAISRGISRSLNNGYLIKKDYVSDRRWSIIKLSKKGQETVKSLTPIILEYEQRLVRAITFEEHSHLMSVLHKLLIQAEQMEG